MRHAPANRRRFARACASAVGFLTVVGGPAPPEPSALAWFGPVGAALGALVGLTWWLSDRAWSPFVAAVLALTVDLALTGLLHLDGVADTADGLLPAIDRDRRLAAMADPALGAFGVVAVGVTLLARTAGLLGLPTGVRAVAVTAGLWAASRTLMAVAVTVLPSARPGGLSARFANARPWPALATGLPLAIALPVVGRGVVGLAGLGIGLLAGGAVLTLARRRLGGITGDVLGAAGVMTETVGLLALAAHW